LPPDATSAPCRRPPAATLAIKGSHLPERIHAESHVIAQQHDDVFRRGIEHFNTGRYFEAHEVWEEIWLRSPEPDKTFLQGIIQVAAAFHHYSRGNTRGTRSLLEAGLGRLERFPATHRGIDLDELRAAAKAWVAMLAATRIPGAETLLPQIKFTARA
jgi:uncharacterized protein